MDEGAEDEEEGLEEAPEAGAELDPLAEPEADPDAEPEAGGVALLEDDEGEEEGELEDELFFEASSPQADRANAAAAAISNALVITIPLDGVGGPLF